MLRYLGKMAIGTLVLLLALTELCSLPINDHKGIGTCIFACFLVLALVGVSSALLYSYANFKGSQLLGSLGIFFVLLFIWSQCDEAVQKYNVWVIGAFLTVPWLVGFAIAAAIRHWLRS